MKLVLVRKLWHWLTALAVVAILVLAPTAQAATITVTTTKDELNADGDCSLREAIRAANLDTAVDACPAGSGADTITLALGTYPLTLAGLNEDLAQTGDLDITSTITIAGMSPTSTIIDGKYLDRVFEVRPGASAQLSNMTIRKGRSVAPNAGGGIRNAGTLGLSNIIISDSSVDGRGAGIYNEGTLTIVYSLLNSNLAQDFFDGDTNERVDAVGGGIYNTGSLTITSSTISNNRSFGLSPSAGGIFNEGTLTVATSTINTNNSESGGGIDNRGTATITGSAIRSNGADIGGSIINSGTITIDGSTISGIASSSGGGGITNDHVLTVINSTIRDSFSRDTGAGLWNRSGEATLRNVTIANNRDTSGAGGGGITNDATLTIENSTISGNHAEQRGGGILNERGVVRLNSVTIANNVASSGGGGVDNAGTLMFTNTLVAGNNANGRPDCSGTLNSGGYNLIQQAAGCTITGTTTGNQLGVNPQLGPLADNGGAAETHALLAGSPAIDAGVRSGCLPFDQRGVSRPRDGDGNGSAICDIGAFER